ncbi:hypothetical protein BDZ91DRAFT_802750 [Kalaharituber pfeilii]|nr:hypothetical protein BDZ91DRAFT_802750 [Kalaharituber pfeilii]
MAASAAVAENTENSAHREAEAGARLKMGGPEYLAAQRGCGINGVQMVETVVDGETIEAITADLTTDEKAELMRIRRKGGAG